MKPAIDPTTGVNKHCEPGKVNIEVVQDKHGDFGLYINDLRVAGNKPWCGGRIVKEFVTNEDTILAALDSKERKLYTAGIAVRQ